jgi:hypothetical protein
VDLAHDVLLGFLEEGLRRDIAAFLERNAARAKELTGRHGGVLYGVKVFRSATTDQPVTGEPFLIQALGAGATPEEALLDSQALLAGDPDGMVRYDAESSGYLFATVTTSGSLTYAKYFGGAARSVRAKADALQHQRHPNGMSGLIGVAGRGGSVVSTRGSRKVDVVHPPDRHESETRRGHEQSEREQQHGAQLEHYREDQRTTDGHDQEKREREAHEFNDHSSDKSETENRTGKDNSTNEREREKHNEKSKSRPERTAPSERRPLA